MRPLNYSPLYEPLTNEDISRVPANAGATSKSTIVSLGFLIAGMVLFVALTTAFNVIGGGNGSSALISLFMYGVILLAIVLGVVYRRKFRRQELARLYRFAGVNGLGFSYDVMPETQRGLIFDNGDERKIKECFKFPDGVEIGNYEFVTSNGKNRSVNRYTYARIALSRHLPNMVLDARGNNMFNFSNLPDVLHASQRLKLEGDFNQYFDVYVPTGYERDALYVFTPDVMQVLIEQGAGYDIEIVDDELYLYRTGRTNFALQQGLAQLLDVAGSITQELRDQTRRYSDERVEAASTTGPIAEQGKRLRSGTNYTIAIIVVAAFLMNGSNMLLTFLAPELATLFTMIGFAAIIFFVWYNLRRHRP